MLDRNECLLEHLGAVQLVSLDLHLEARLVGVDLEAGNVFRRQLDQISQRFPLPVTVTVRVVESPTRSLFWPVSARTANDPTRPSEGLRPSLLGERPDIERDRLCTEVLRYGLPTATGKGIAEEAVHAALGSPLLDDQLAREPGFFDLCRVLGKGIQGLLEFGDGVPLAVDDLLVLRFLTQVFHPEALKRRGIPLGLDRLYPSKEPEGVDDLLVDIRVFDIHVLARVTKAMGRSSVEDAAGRILTEMG